MKRIIALLLTAGVATLASAQPNVGVSISITQPGVYGRIDVGSAPPPPVVYVQPVIVSPTPVRVYQQPLYLYVPRGQQKHWAKHCARYYACRQPVYFVQENWVRERYSERLGVDSREGKWHGERKHDGQKHKGKHGDDR